MKQMEKVFETLDKLKVAAFLNAVNHGWHEDEKPDAHWFTLVITELCEAVQADRKGHHANLEYFERRCADSRICQGLDPNISKEKGFQVSFEYAIKDSVEDELADVVIRLLDYCGMSQIPLKYSDILEKYASSLSLPTFTEQIYVILDIASSDYDDVEYKCNLLLYIIFQLAASLNIDLLKFIELKMQYNEYREYRHGGKRY